MAEASSREEGVVYVASTGDYFTSPEINAEKLTNLRQNVYGRGLSIKQKNLIFSDKYNLTIKDDKGEVDEELSTRITQMCEAEDVRLWAKMQLAYINIFWYGAALFNPVWGYEDNEYRLLKLRSLPSETFATPPLGENQIYSQILQGIVWDKDKKQIRFYQSDENSFDPTELKNIFMIKDPTASDLAGESIVLPLVPVLEMVKFVWQAQMQQSNRIGAQLLFIKVTDPQPASNLNGNVSDVEYANNLLQSWNKNTAFQLRENMELIDPGLSDTSNNLEVIDALHSLMIDYLTPTSFIARGQSTPIVGSSDKQREELLLQYISGVHEWLEDQFEMLLQKYLDYNEYKGYTISLEIPTPEIDKSELKLKQVAEGVKGKALFPNEIRERLGAEALSEEDLEKLAEYYERIGPTEAPMGFLQVTHQNENVRTGKFEQELEEISDELAEDILKALKLEGL